jgi:hypothetical protein
MIYKPQALSTFEQVEAKYNSVKPLVSKHHKREDDIRPLGDRRRKWERIERVDSNKYVLHDAVIYSGINPYEASNSYWWAYINRPPITWERKDGKEFVTVRPNIQMSHDTSRYQFLRAYLPSGLYFDNHTKHGRHMINNVFIARPKYGRDKTDYHLTFEREIPPLAVYHSDLRWKCITKPWAETRSVVDKGKKAELRADLEQFYEWICSVGLLLDVEYENLKHLQNEAQDYIDVNGLNPNVVINVRSDFPVSIALQILKDYNHPLRIHLATNFLVRMDNRRSWAEPNTSLIKSIKTVEDQRNFRAKYNSWANKAFGLMTDEEFTNVGN